MAKKSPPKKKAKKKAVPKLVAEKLNPSDPDYFRKLGERGGKANTKNRPEGYFAKLAEKSHRKRVENREARERGRTKSDAA